ncbi:MAG: RNB domain-containing ribonuclease [Coriobacteriales bacterium]|jgi:ribonuclease R|nr:RNB domain-containing ribonuclease [Coriobacteriales bacterium]
MARHNRKGRRHYNQMSVGVIHIARRGYAFVETPEGEYFVTRGHLGGAMDGDCVEVVRLRSLEARRRQQMKTSSSTLVAAKARRRDMLGSVRRVLERAHETIVGELHYSDGLGIVRPFNECIPYDIFLDTRAPAGKRAEEGDAVVVRITSYPGRREAAAGYIEEVIGCEEGRSRGIEVIIREHGFETSFSAAALEEAQRLARVGVSQVGEAGLATTTTAAITPPLPRRDLRERFIFTIDPDDARDFDDALSVDFIDGRMRLGVHIADVSAYVAWNSALDLDARRRATSVYLPDRVIPMLPASLSEELCSLRPGEDRLAFTVEMILNSDGSVAECDFYPSLIRSSLRLTYDEAQRILDEGKTEAGFGPKPKEDEGGDKDDTLGSRASFEEESVPSSSPYNRLLALHRLAKKLMRRRIRRGSIEFEGVEAKLRLDADGRPLEVRLRGRSDATSMIEEAMILANEQVAAYLRAQESPMVYRVHEEPFAATLDELLPVLQEFGYARQGAPRDSHEIQAILEASAGRPEHALISTLLLRAMKRAKYAPFYAGHFGLASAAYTHFTSPIRRYPDLLVHRLLKHQLAGEPPAKDMARQLGWLCEHSSEQEREAEAASREATALKLCEYLAPRIGERFAGIITAVNTLGFVVREETTSAEGFVDRESLAEDFIYEAERYRYHNPDTGRAYRLGQPINVILKGVDDSSFRLLFTPAKSSEN